MGAASNKMDNGTGSGGTKKQQDRQWEGRRVGTKSKMTGNGRGSGWVQVATRHTTGGTGGAKSYMDEGGSGEKYTGRQLKNMHSCREFK